MNPKENRNSRLEKFSFAVACLSLAVAVLAGGVSLAAWRRPIPPDPTQIPSFVEEKVVEEKPFEVIDAGAEGEKFFKFLDDHPGRKLRIIAAITDPNVSVRPDEGNPLQSSFLSIPCRIEPDCQTHSLVIKANGKGDSGLFYDSGTWKLMGYFANFGISGVKRGTIERSITAIDIVTAVS